MPEPHRIEFETGPLSELLRPKAKDLGGFFVRRALPMVRRRHVGPVVFFDEMGPAEFEPGEGINVRPHPHIGLATITYLFDGAIMHRDSLGTAQVIRRGAVNWMVAGKGIVHSERVPGKKDWQARLHGLQLWVALPAEKEEKAPAFVHVPASDVPEERVDGLRIRALVGTPFGMRAGAQGESPMAYAALEFDERGAVEIPAEFEERAIYASVGKLELEGRGARHVLKPGQMAILREGQRVWIRGEADVRAAYIGGTPHPEPRHLVWNFVSSRPELIEDAKRDWQAEKFPRVPGDESERIPLPG